MPKTILRKEFFGAFVTALADLRLWIIVIPSLVLIGVALALTKPWLGSVIAVAITLVDARLINTIEQLPKPDAKEFATGVYGKLVLPAIVGILLISNSDILARMWLVPWRWSHARDAVLPCSYIWIAAGLNWFGVFLVATFIAILTKRRAVFATVIGLAVFLPLNLTESFSGDNMQRATSVLAKSCQMDLSDFDAEAFDAGFVTAILIQALTAIFIAKVVSAWLSRRDSQSNQIEV